MKFLKTYELHAEINYDIREFFSNLKKITIYFKDYDLFNNTFNKVCNDLNFRKEMSFFGFTNDSNTSFHPIIDYVSRELHNVFDLAEKNEWQKIYDFFNSSQLNYFEDFKRFYFSLDTAISKKLAQSLNERVKYPYYYTKIYSRTWHEKVTDDQMKNIKNILESNIDQEKYKIDVDRLNNTIVELEIISKIIPEFSKKDLYEIEKAKEFGIKKYDELKNYIDNIDILKKSTKYNI